MKIQRKHRLMEYAPFFATIVAAIVTLIAALMAVIIIFFVIPFWDYVSIGLLVMVAMVCLYGLFLAISYPIMMAITVFKMSYIPLTKEELKYAGWDKSPEDFISKYIKSNYFSIGPFSNIKRPDFKNKEIDFTVYEQFIGLFFKEGVVFHNNKEVVKFVKKYKKYFSNACFWAEYYKQYSSISKRCGDFCKRMSPLLDLMARIESAEVIQAENTKGLRTIVLKDNTGKVWVIRTDIDFNTNLVEISENVLTEFISYLKETISDVEVAYGQFMLNKRREKEKTNKTKTPINLIINRCFL